MDQRNQETQEVEWRFFRQACKFSFWGALAFWLIVFFMDLPKALWFCTLGAASVSGLLYIALARIKKLEFLIPIYFFSLCVCLSVGFFYNGGVQATVLFVYFVLASIYLYVFPRHSHYFLVFIILNGAFLIGADYLGWVQEPPHQSKGQRYLDLWLAWSLSMVVMGWITKFAKNAYEKEKQKAMELAHAKGRFLATMSHEIRTPLNGILGINSMALEKAAPSLEIRSHLELVEESAEHLLSVVNDILDYSKIEAGQMKLESVEFPLTQLLERLHHNFSLLADSKGLEWNLQGLDSVSGVWVGDPQRLRQVLYNLISNALKFTERGEVSVQVDCFNEGSKRPIVEFKVVDTGIGIRKEDLENLFQDYVQAEHQSSRLYGGTGLGLSICKSLVKLMGGVISVKSEWGKGAEFHFQIPLEKKEAIEPVIVEKAPEQKMDWSGHSVLLAEDNKINQKVVRALLTKLNLNVRVAENGREALEILEEEDFDLILMDLEMPILGGLETARNLRARPEKKFRKIPIIALTAHALSNVKEMCIDAGMNSYLTKPLKLETLREALEPYFEDSSL